MTPLARRIVSILKVSLALLCLGSTPHAHASSSYDAGDEGLMTVVQIHDYQISGAEYWPFRGSAPFRYPADVLWGFYPDGVNPKAIGCAESSYRALSKFLEANWPRLKKAVSLGATRRFYLRTNDYTEASSERPLRAMRMWHWTTGMQDYRTGYWKWESNLTQSGDCVLPQPEQITEALDEAIRALSR